MTLLAIGRVKRLALGTAASLAANAGLAQSQGLEEILVTAQFRAQNVQHTPIAISAFDADALEARSSLDIVDAANLSPNVALTRNAGNFGQMASIFIRGVGQYDPHFAVEPGVGMYVDDVYFGVLTGAVFELLDAERVEVLRGPQGTLAGKNSIGGAVKLFSRQPSEAPVGHVELGFGSFDRITGRAATNVTLVEEKLYARVSIMARQRDGYVDRLDYACVTGATAGGTQRLARNCRIGTQGGESVWAARGTLRWIGAERVTNTFSLDVTQDNSETPAEKQLFQSPLWAGSENYLTGPKEYTNYETYISRPTGQLNSPTPFTMPTTTPLDALGVSNTLDVQLGESLALKWVAAYRESTVGFSTTAEATPTSLTDQVWQLDHKQVTQELRLSGGRVDGFEWTVGAFHYDADGKSTGRINIPGGFAPGGGGLDVELFLDDPVETRSDSVFAHAAFHPTDRLTLTTGVRYTEDSKAFTFNRYDYQGNPHPTLATGPDALLNLTSKYEGKQTDYRVAVDYQISDNFMLYGQVSTGIKGGGVNPRPFFASQALPFEPEELEALEIGFKSLLAGNRVRLNAAVFTNDYSELQLALGRCDAFSPFPGAPCLMTANVGDAEIEGVELEVDLRPTDRLAIDLAVGVLDFQYTRVEPNTAITLDMQPPYVPDKKYSAGIQYEFNLPRAGRLTPRLDYHYRSEMQAIAINNPLTSIDDLGLMNFRLTWQSGSEDWSAVLAITNLADKFYIDGKFGDGGPTLFTQNGHPGWPREAFVTLRRSF